MGKQAVSNDSRCIRIYDVDDNDDDDDDDDDDW